jgi:hypothetical protein
METIDKIINSVEFKEGERIVELDEALELYKLKGIEFEELENVLNHYLSNYKNSTEKDEAFEKYLKISQSIYKEKFLN